MFWVVVVQKSVIMNVTELSKKAAGDLYRVYIC